MIRDNNHTLWSSPRGRRFTQINLPETIWLVWSEGVRCPCRLYSCMYSCMYREDTTIVLQWLEVQLYLINLPETIWLVWSEDATIHPRGIVVYIAAPRIQLYIELCSWARRKLAFFWATQSFLWARESFWRFHVFLIWTSSSNRCCPSNVQGEIGLDALYVPDSICLLHSSHPSFN